ncbi:MAG: hypothetical protein OQL06_01980 [Gammaproteobacteria bacterium]|nr:hypothetical protein [Gammaproteobacteria bacterium]
MCHRKQQGAALILLVLVIVLTGAVFVVTNFSIDRGIISQEAKTSQSLRNAKEALLSFVSTYNLTNATTFPFNNRNGLLGFLPCPENATSVNEGEISPSCGAQYVNVLGRFPWKTLGLDVQKDSSGSCLWYAVSGEYKNIGRLDRRALNQTSGLTRSEMLNEDTNGAFRLFDQQSNIIAGNRPDNRVVAIIIAPGARLNNQNRTKVAGNNCGNFNANNYLEQFNGIDNRSVSNNADSIDDFITANIGSNTFFNDRIITITRQEIFNALSSQNTYAAQFTRTTRALAECLASFGNNNSRRLPWPAPLAPGDYRDGRLYIETAGGHLGRFPADLAISGGQFILENTICSAVTNGANNINFNAGVPNSMERRIWENWKDHFFYVVAGDYDPNSTPPAPGACINCLTFNGGVTDYSAMVIFSETRQAGQIRDALPIDPDTKNVIASYLEGPNVTNFPDIAGNGNYVINSVANPNVNDTIICIQDTVATGLTVVDPCTM